MISERHYGGDGRVRYEHDTWHGEAFTALSRAARERLEREYEHV